MSITQKLADSVVRHPVMPDMPRIPVKIKGSCRVALEYSIEVGLVLSLDYAPDGPGDWLVVQRVIGSEDDVAETIPELLAQVLVTVAQ